MKAALSFVSEYARPLLGLAALGLIYLLDVVSLHGLLVALFLQPADDLLSPLATRIAWYVIFYGVGVATIARLMWREGVLSFESRRQMFAAAHVSAYKRIERRARWWAKGIGSAAAQYRAHRPVLAWWRRILTPVQDLPVTLGTTPHAVPKVPVDEPAAA
jgi:hypothetical protein